MLQVQIVRSQKASQQTHQRKKVLQQVVANISTSHAAVASAQPFSDVFPVYHFNLRVNTFILISLLCFLIIICNFLPSPRGGI